MADPLPKWNKHVRDYAARHHLRLRLAEDGEVRILLGPRTTENHASIHSDKKGWTWAVYYTAPQASRVTDAVAGVATRCVPLDGEGFYLVREKDLLRAASLSSWTKPRFQKIVAQKANQRKVFDAFVQSLDAA